MQNLLQNVNVGDIITLKDVNDKIKIEIVYDTRYKNQIQGLCTVNGELYYKDGSNYFNDRPKIDSVTQSNHLIPLPTNIPSPPAGWLYVGTRPFEALRTPSETIAAYLEVASKWGLNGYCGNSNNTHYAVRVGSPEHIELFNKFNNVVINKPKIEFKLFDGIDDFITTEDFQKAYLEWKENNATITLGGITFPKPVSKPLNVGEEFHVASLTQSGGYHSYTWKNESFYMRCLENEIVQRTREGAIAQSKATIAAYKGGAA